MPAQPAEHRRALGAQAALQGRQGASGRGSRTHHCSSQAQREQACCRGERRQMKVKAVQGAGPSPVGKETAVPSHSYRRALTEEHTWPSVSSQSGRRRDTACRITGQLQQRAGRRRPQNNQARHAAHAAHCVPTCARSSTAGFKLPAVLSYRGLHTNIPHLRMRYATDGSSWSWYTVISSAARPAETWKREVACSRGSRIARNARLQARAGAALQAASTIAPQQPTYRRYCCRGRCGAPRCKGLQRHRCNSC